MKTVGAFEAKTHFSHLLEEVSDGATITITKHGVPVVRMVPARGDRRPIPDEAVDALIEFQERANITLGDLTIREMIEEGRR
ncbi:MAG: type II toxin-antitoxin system Phd/YefM family antitoxin [Thermomicrobiales bacterium]